MNAPPFSHTTLGGGPDRHLRCWNFGLNGLEGGNPGYRQGRTCQALPRQSLTRQNACHYILDWNWDEDLCILRYGHSSANISALRRFAIGAIKAKSGDTVAATTQRMARNLRLVFNYLRMTCNSRYRPQSLQGQAG